MEKARLAQEKAKADARQKALDEKKKAEEARKQELERQKAEQERQAALVAKKSKFEKAKPDEKVFETRGSQGNVSYEDLVNAFIARIEKIARTSFGLPFLKELVKRGELMYEKAMSFYLKETRAALKYGLAKKYKKEIEKRGKTKKVDYIKYDFEFMLQQVMQSMGLKKPEYVDERRLKKRFEELVMKASRNNMLERIVMGEPFLEF
jgi:hypothetical protein